jgi:hypothetical protein
MTNSGLHNIQTANTPWYTELGFMIKNRMHVRKERCILRCEFFLFNFNLELFNFKIKLSNFFMKTSVKFPNIRFSFSPYICTLLREGLTVHRLYNNF